MVIVSVKFRTALPEEEVLAVAKERSDAFRALPGLLQKYYIKDPQSGEYGGIYFWESYEALAAYRDSELARSIPAAYQVTEPPRIEVLERVYTLRPEKETIQS